MTLNWYTGVWFADRALDINEGAGGDIVLAVEMPDDVAEPYEWVQDIGYREFLNPRRSPTSTGARRSPWTSEICPSTKPSGEKMASQSMFLLHICCTPKTSYKGLTTQTPLTCTYTVGPAGLEPATNGL
jgi:hypothetical protein